MHGQLLASVLCLFALAYFALAMPEGAIAGNAKSANFLVLASADRSGSPPNQLAESILRRAETYRGEISRDLFGYELPDGDGRTLVNFSSAEHDRGLTWAKDSAGRSQHVVYLSGDVRTCFRGPLRHEMVHVLLATRYPGKQRLDAWIEEGLASRYDSDDLIAYRREIIRDWLTQDSIPNIQRVLQAENIVASDAEAYCVSATLVDFLLEAGGKAKLLRFGELTNQRGAENALTSVYGLKSSAELARHWETWLAQKLKTVE